MQYETNYNGALKFSSDNLTSKVEPEPASPPNLDFTQNSESIGRIDRSQRLRRRERLPYGKERHDFTLT